MKYVVAYDIVSDKLRNKVAECLEDFGDRVQMSVFEVDIDSAQYQRMVTRLRPLIDSETDSVRIYPVCSACLEKVLIIGLGTLAGDPDVIVI